MSGESKLDFSEVEYIGCNWKNCEMVRLPPGFVVPEIFKDEIPAIYNLEVRPDDIWLLGLFKTGTTWATEMIWGVYHEGDLTEAKSKYALEKWPLAELNLELKFRTLEMTEKEKEEYFSQVEPFYTGSVIDRLKKAKSPRFIRSHLPLSWLPPKLLDTCKVVYMSRNYKDSWISRFKQLEGSAYQPTDTVEEFAELFLQDKAQYSPYPKHTKEAWEKRFHKNVYFLFYEDMKKDLPGVIRKMADFLGKNLSDEQIEILLDHLDIDNMRRNKFVNNEEFKEVGWMAKNVSFIRKGMVGEWKNVYSPEFLEKYNAWWRKHMGDCDFKFPED